GETAQKIEVLLAGLVVQVAALAAHRQNRQAVVSRNQNAFLEFGDFLEAHVHLARQSSAANRWDLLRRAMLDALKIGERSSPLQFIASQPSSLLAGQAAPRAAGPRARRAKGCQSRSLRGQGFGRRRAISESSRRARCR